MTKFYLIDEEQITLAQLLAHTSPEVRRHATGALKAIQKNAARIIKEQDARLTSNHGLIVDCYDDARAHCSHCGWHYAATGYRTPNEIQKIFNQSH